MKRKTAVLAISFLSCALIAASALAWTNHNRAKASDMFISHNFQHAFGEFVTGVSEMDTALQKSLYSMSPSVTGAVCTEIFGKAMTAQMSLGVLPFSTHEMERTAGFISQVGDYAFALSRAAARGETITEEQRQALTALSETASLLAENMKQLQNELDTGGVTMNKLVQSEEKLDRMEEEILPKTVGDGVKLIEQEFPEVPALIYDGPFSEHLTNASPKMLEGLAEIDVNAGRAIAAKFAGVTEGRVYPAGECGGDIPAYYYGVNVDGGELTLALSKQGGIVMSMMSSRIAGAGERSIDDALARAKRFLETRGYRDMRETYYYNDNNNLTVNFAYSQDGVVCYSDLVKVSVAMDTGAISGFEAMGYITSHYARELPAVEVEQQQAMQMVSTDMEVLGHEIVLVPSDGRYEVLCHEFKCQAGNDKKYIIYVNAVTGQQEKILLLLEDENGALTL